MLREPAVAGRFYPGKRDELVEELRSLMPGEGKGTGFSGALVPHAGYVFSGRTAGAVYSKVSLPPSVIILSPNHTGRGAPASVWPSGFWRTPLGDMETDSRLAEAIIRNSSILEADYDAHIYEHSIEVQLPFLRYLREDIKIAPVTLSDFSLSECEEISSALFEAVKAHTSDVSVIASSDMSHYESEKTAKEKDKLAIDAMLAMDGGALYSAVREKNISMCGNIPAVVMLMTVKKLGARKAELVEYATSARASGDYSSVVGYCGIIFR